MHLIEAEPVKIDRNLAHHSSDGRYASKPRREANITLVDSSSSEKDYLSPLKLRNPLAISRAPGHAATFLLNKRSRGKTTSQYTYDARTERATNPHGILLNLTQTKGLLKEIRDEQGSKVGIERMQAILRDAIQHDQWTPRLPVGATPLGETIMHEDRAGDPIASIRYKLGAATHIVTAGPKGAVEVWERGAGPTKQGCFVVHSPTPNHQWDEDFGPRKCDHLEAGKCYPDSSTGAYDSMGFMFSSPTATLAHDYNLNFTDDPAWD